MNALFSGLHAALFDLDGTLIETHIDFDFMRTEVARLAGAFGLRTPMPRDILGSIAMIRNRLREEGRPEDADRFRADAYAMLQEIEVEQCGAPVEIPGAKRLLDMLEGRGVAVGIVTRNCRPVAERLLEQGGLRCRCLVTRDDVEHVKPDPSHLITAVGALGRGGSASPRSVITDYSRCLMVGDHFMDVQAGRAAGMRTVGVLRGKPVPFFDDCPPDLVVEDIAALIAMVEEAA